MKQLLATLALIGVLVEAGIVYPQAMKVYSVDEDENGNYSVTLCASSGLLYCVNTDSKDYTPGEMMAVVMYENMTPNDPTDDEVIAMRRTGW